MKEIDKNSVDKLYEKQEKVIIDFYEMVEEI